MVKHKVFLLNVKLKLLIRQIEIKIYTWFFPEYFKDFSTVKL